MVAKRIHTILASKFNKTLGVNWWGMSAKGSQKKPSVTEVDTRHVVGGGDTRVSLPTLRFFQLSCCTVELPRHLYNFRVYFYEFFNVAKVAIILRKIQPNLAIKPDA